MPADVLLSLSHPICESENKRFTNGIPPFVFRQGRAGFFGDPSPVGEESAKLFRHDGCFQFSNCLRLIASSARFREGGWIYIFMRGRNSRFGCALKGGNVSGLTVDEPWKNIKRDSHLSGLYVFCLLRGLVLMCVSLKVCYVRIRVVFSLWYNHFFFFAIFLYLYFTCIYLYLFVFVLFEFYLILVYARC